MTQNDIVMLLRRGIKSLQNNNPAAAENDFRQILTLNPKHPDALHLLGIIANMKGNKSEAVKLIKKAIKFNSKAAVYHRNIGLILMDLGKHRDAISHLSQSVRLDDKESDTYNDLGTAYSATGRTEEAIKAYRSAIRINPQNFLAHNNLGIDLAKSGKHEQAIDAFKQSISLKTDYPEAYFNLGRTLFQCQRNAEAIDAFMTAVQHQPNYPEAYLTLGDVFKETENIDEAINSYKTAIQCKPEYSEAYSRLCEIYDTSHLTEEFEKTLQLAQKALHEDDPWLLFHRAQLSSTHQQFKETGKLLERINLKQVQPKLAASSSVLLAKTYDRTGEYTKAFRQFDITNKITQNLVQNQPFSGKRYLEKVTSQIDLWSNAQPPVWPEPEIDTQPDALAFLVGFPRSGTTLLDTILRSHPAIAVTEEKPMVDAMKRQLAQAASPACLSSLDKSAIEALENTYMDSLESHTETEQLQKLIIDKYPLNITDAALIHRVFPASKFILALRHPYDCVLSCYMQYFRLNDAMANFLDLEQAAKLYDATMTLWLHYTQALDLQVKTVKYEELVVDLKGTTEPLLKFLDLEWDQGLLDYQNTALSRDQIKTPSYNQVTQELYTHASGRWKRYEDQLQKVMPILKPWAERFGYIAD